MEKSIFEKLSLLRPSDLIIYSTDQDFLSEIKSAIEKNQDVKVDPVGTVPAGGFAPEQIIALLLALSSAGAFTTIYQTLAKFLERNKDREITLQRGDVKITIKGHSLPEERALIRELFPEASLYVPK